MGLYGKASFTGYSVTRPSRLCFFILSEVKAIKELRINDEIRTTEVRLVGDGDETQIMSFRDALNYAMDKGMDLVEISPNAKPPVCRVMDYGKYRFEQVKREKEAKKNQRVTQIKEVKFRPNIEDHDFETKIKNAERFLNDGDKVKVTVMFRGREITHQELGFAICKRTTERLAEVAIVEKPPKVEGKNMTLILVPKAAK